MVAEEEVRMWDEIRNAFKYKYMQIQLFRERLSEQFARNNPER